MPTPNQHQTATIATMNDDNVVFDLALAAPVLNTIASLIKVAKANNGGKVPYGYVMEVMNKQKVMYPWVTKDCIYNHIKRLNKQLNGSSNAITTTSAIQANGASIQTLSSLSTLTQSLSSDNDNHPPTTISPPGSPSEDHEVETSPQYTSGPV